VAYSALQKRSVARELARSGGNISAARTRLRNEYEQFREISENTIRRMMADVGFAEVMGEEAAALTEAARAGAAQAERERAMREAQGTYLSRLAGDEALLDQFRERIATLMKNPDVAELPIMLRAWNTFARMVERRKEQLIPAIAETVEATWLVESVYQASVAMFDQARAKHLVTRIRELYEVKKSQAQTKGAATPNA